MNVLTEKGNVEYRVFGTGRPILVMHGGHSNMNDQLASKGFDPKKFLFIIPSRPGYGKTRLEGNQSASSAAELMILLMNSLNIYEFDVIGISAGGPTALCLASNYSERIKHLVLISAVTRKWMSLTDKEYIISKLIFHPMIEPFTWLLSRLIVKYFPSIFARTLFRQVSFEKNIGYYNIDELTLLVHHQRSCRGFLNDLKQKIDDVVFSNINSHTLIIHSYNDIAVDFRHALNARSKINGSRSILLNNNWGHLIWLDKEYIKLAKLISRYLLDTNRVAI